MNRAALLRVAAAVLGGFAVVTVLALFVRMVSASGVPAWPMDSQAGWIVPIVAGTTVGVLSWLLLGGDDIVDSGDSARPTVSCPVCGTELLEEWRLCPYCGVQSDEASKEIGSTRTA